MFSNATSAPAPLPTVDAAALGDRYVLLERTDAAAIEGRILAAQRLENAALEARLLAAQDRAIAERLAPRGGWRDDAAGGPYGMRNLGIAAMALGLVLMLVSWVMAHGLLASVDPDAGYQVASYVDASAAAYTPDADPGFSLDAAGGPLFGFGLVLLIAGAVMTVLNGGRRSALYA